MLSRLILALAALVAAPALAASSAQLENTRVELVSEVGNAKMKVLMWLLKKADANNQIAASLREIAKETGTSVATTQRLMNALLEANVLVRNGRYGLWRLNPDVVFQGSHRGRMNVLVSYRDERQRELFDTAGPQLRRVA